MSKPKTDLTYQQETQTLIGTRKRELIDKETGEEILVDQITKRIYGSRNFWKMYLMDFLAVLGVFDNRQVDIFIYIVENTNQSTNLFIGTYKKIAEDVGCSEPTISKIMKKLVDHKFIKKVQNGLWFVNPNILMKGDDRKRQILLSYYESDEPLNELTYSRTASRLLKADQRDQDRADLNAQLADQEERYKNQQLEKHLKEFDDVE